MTDGRKGGLQRAIGPIGAFFLTLTCLSPTIAVFIVGADVMQQVGTAAVGCFAAAALLGLAMACVYGELGSAIPSAGGEYTIFDRVLGRTAGRGVLGINLLGFAASQALTADGVAASLAAVWPGAPPLHPVAIATVAIVTAVALLHVEAGAWVTGVFLLTEIAALLVVASLGFSHMGQPAAVLLHPVASLAGGFAAPGFAALGAAMAASVYAFNGYGAAIFFGEDMHDAPRHTAPVVVAALIAGVAIVMPPLVATLLGAPDLRAALHADNPVIAVVRRLGGGAVARVMSAGIALALFNTAIAIALMSGRQLYATAQDRLWPARISDALAATHPRWGSPWMATLVMGGLGIAGTFLDRHLLVLVLGNGSVVIYAGLCLAALRGRRSGATTEAPWRMPLFPLPPLLGIIFLAAVAGFTLMDATGRIGLAVSVVTVLISALLFSRAGRTRDATVQAQPGARVVG